LEGILGDSRKELLYFPILFITTNEMDYKNIVEDLESSGTTIRKSSFEAADLISRINTKGAKRIKGLGVLPKALREQFIP
jgi:hypothetical protein